MKKILKALAVIGLMMGMTVLSIPAGARDFGVLFSQAGAEDSGVLVAAARLFSKSPEAYQRMTPAEQDAYFEQTTRSLSAQNRENLRTKYYQAIGRADATMAVQRTVQGDPQSQPQSQPSLASMGKISASFLGDILKRQVQMRE